MELEVERVVEALPAYDIGDELGRGSWGVVLAARHRQLQRQVAVKQLPRELGADQGVRARFIAEARLLASFDHPHIVPIYDFVESDGLCLLVLERLTGGTLLERCQSRPPSPQVACAMILAACAGLHYAHTRSALHRDVKPENLMFSGSDVLKVTDFGIAKLLGGSSTVVTRVGSILGTPAYMAPEQAEAKTLTPATDIYACGTILYELLAGQLPFDEEANPLAVLRQHTHGQPRPLAAVAPDVPRPLARTIDRAIAREPGARYATAQDFGVAIAHAATEAWGPEWLPRSGVTVNAAGAILTGVGGNDAPPGDTDLRSTVRVPRPDASARPEPVRSKVAPTDGGGIRQTNPTPGAAPTPAEPPLGTPVAKVTSRRGVFVLIVLLVLVVVVVLGIALRG